jgi:hypothetical protein
MEAGCELQASAALNPANGTPVPNKLEAERDPVPVLMFWRTDSLLSLLGIDTRLLGRPAHSTTAIPSQLPRHNHTAEIRPRFIPDNYVSRASPDYHQPHMTPMTPTSQLPTNSRCSAAQQWVREADKVTV